MKLEFYYYSYQCPLNIDMLKLLDEYTDRIKITTFDISKYQYKELAKELQMFFPTLIIVEEQYRYYSPLRKEFLEQLSCGILPKEVPYLPNLGREYIEEVIEPLTKSNITIACECCGYSNATITDAKRVFFESKSQEIYGYLHKTKDNKLLGGVEYLPSMIVPYDIPKEEDTAFITCLYGSDARCDYKTAPLKQLEKYLKYRYNKLIVITDEHSVFPNGNLIFFLEHGYKDEGILYEDTNYCRLHLMSKRLRYL